ncbi:DUF7344 domain-containing protein [Natrinema amylolyticum]|uniref:DUF7344 domain-containing protein n=1 Tax=Natrinema amylolyticum TaxID=2878679 RepID=UPI001CFBAC47|nr:hypothetical protein [Natrinema amylolyticum]
MSRQSSERSKEFLTVLREQKGRILSALLEDGTIPATPILWDDETLSCEEYVTLVYELHHVHLPELKADGFVEFDRHRDEVRRGERF